MTKKEMLRILRCEILLPLDSYKKQLAEIANELERSEGVMHGHWIRDGVFNDCSVCKMPYIQPHINGNPTFEYCPNCGARMDEMNE